MFDPTIYNVLSPIFKKSEGINAEYIDEKLFPVSKKLPLTYALKLLSAVIYKVKVLHAHNIRNLLKKMIVSPFGELFQF